MLHFIFIALLLLTGCSQQHSSLKREAPEGMVYIPPGWFEMGSSEMDGRVGLAIGVDEIPRHQVYVKGFYIDRYEATNSEFLDFLLETNNSYRPSHWEERGTFFNNEENHPVLDVDWEDAEEYCRWRGKRLLTEAEWEKAARGTDGRLWPWGNEFSRDKANTQESGRGWTANVGSYPDDVSPYGVYDMAGNVKEWIDGWYEQYQGNNVPSNHYSGQHRVLRGGSYTTPLYLNARTAFRFAVASTIATRGHNWHSAFDHGIRCAKDP